jgi:hypothetical protein
MEQSRLFVHCAMLFWPPTKDAFNSIRTSHLSRDRNLNTLQTKLSCAKQSSGDKSPDIHLALSMCCHSAISTIDHIGEIVSKYGKGSQSEKLKLHRTKCTKLIQNVISASLEDEISEEMKQKPFSILIDEFTDVMGTKHLCITCQYFKKRKRIVDDFLGFIPVTSTTGEELFRVLKEKLESLGLSLKNCLGYDSDGAANVIGAHNSVWSRVKSESENCVLMRCTCLSQLNCPECL